MSLRRTKENTVLFQLRRREMNGGQEVRQRLTETEKNKKNANSRGRALANSFR